MFRTFFDDMGIKEVIDGCKDLEEAKGAYLEFLREISKQKKKFVKKMRDIYRLEEPDGDLDGRARLIKRNADMKGYARSRMAVKV